MASAGDVNGDGFLDVIVGAPGHDGVAGLDCGAAYVFYGSAQGFPASPSWSLEGETARSRYGAAVASAGDVDGDGYGDVAIGAPGFDVPNEDHFVGAGRFYLYLGSAQGLSTAPSLVIDGQPYDLGFREGLGGTLTAGDFNGDGFSDVVAGQYARYLGGSARVFYGSPSGPSPDREWSMPGIVLYQGRTVTAADVDGDGFDDLIVTTLDQEFGPSQAIVYLGSGAGLPEIPEDGPPPAPDFVFIKWSYVARLGDLDHDGADELLVTYGDYYANETLFHALYRGSASGPVVWGEPSPVQQLPGRLNPIGDLDGDGFADAITQDGSTFFLYYGSASGFDPLSDGMGTLDAVFGAAGDVTLDGYADFLVGDASGDRVDLYSGGPDWLLGVTADVTIVKEAAPDFGFHMSVTNAGPDPVRLRIVDVLPAPIENAGWYCEYGAVPVAARCQNTHEPLSGDIAEPVTMPPGGSIGVWIHVPEAPVLPVVNTASLGLAEWLQDPDLSNNQSTASYGPAEAPIFSDGFESGDLSAWSSHSPRGLRVGREAALDGLFGLRATVVGRAASVVRDETPQAESGYHARFWFDPHGFGRAVRVGRRRAATAATLFAGSADGTTPLFEVRLERDQGGLFLSTRVRLDGGTLLGSPRVALADAPHTVDVLWRRATGPGANDGLLVLYLDGGDAGTLSGLDNDALGAVDFVELGLVPELRPRLRQFGRSVFVDSFASWRVQ